MSLSEQVKTGAYTLLSKAWCDISEDAKNVVQQMLIVKASDRISLNDVLNSSWIYKVCININYNVRKQSSEMNLIGFRLKKLSKTKLNLLLLERRNKCYEKVYLRF